MGGCFRKVLVPYDFSEHAAEALRVALALAGAENGHVLVLHVLPPLSRLIGVPLAHFPPAVVTSQLVADQQHQLEACVARELAGRRSPRVVCRVVVADPLRAILSLARGATAIVMGTLGLTGLPHLVIGSLAEKVVRHAPVPVLTIRSGLRTGLRAARPGRRASGRVRISARPRKYA